jgi:hypothetical protein
MAGWLGTDMHWTNIGVVRFEWHGHGKIGSVQ